MKGFKLYAICMLTLLVLIISSCDREDNNIEIVTVPEIEHEIVIVGTDEDTIHTLDYIHFVSPCYELVYPIEVILDDGSTESADDKSILDGIMYDEKVVSYVFTLELEDGTGTKVIDNSDELFEEDCKGLVSTVFHLAFCNCQDMTVDYAVEIIDQTNTIIQVENYTDLSCKWFEWLGNRTSNDDFLEFVYPFTMLDDANVQTTMENANDVIDFINDNCD